MISSLKLGEKVDHLPIAIIREASEVTTTEWVRMELSIKIKASGVVELIQIILLLVCLLNSTIFFIWKMTIRHPFKVYVFSRFLEEVTMPNHGWLNAMDD